MLPSTDPRLWPADLHPAMKGGREASRKDDWVIRRGTHASRHGQWKVSNLLGAKEDRPWISVLELEAGKPLSLQHLWPQEGPQPAKGLLGTLGLLQPTLLLRAYERPDDSLQKVLKAFATPAEPEPTTDWGRKNLDDCFQHIWLEQELQDPGSLHGLYFEGALHLTPAGGDATRGFLGLIPSLQWLLSADPAHIAARQVRGCIAMALAEKKDHVSKKATWFSLDWQAVADASRISFKAGPCQLHITALGLTAVVTPEDQHINRLRGSLQLEIGAQHMAAVMEADLAAQRVSFTAHPDITIGLAWLKSLVGDDLEEAGGTFLKDLPSTQFRLLQISGTLSWKDGLKLSDLSFTLRLEDAAPSAGGQPQGIPLAGGRLTPTLTVMADFRDGKKTRVDIRVTGVLAWEQWQLDAHLDTRSGDFGAQLRWQQPEHDQEPAVRDFMAARLKLAKAEKKPGPIPRTKAAKAAQAAKAAPDQDPTLQLVLEGSYQENRFHFKAASAQWYQLPWDIESPCFVGELHLEGSYQAAKAGTPTQWDIRLGGKAAVRDRLEVALEGSYEHKAEKQTLEIKFKAGGIDLAAICGAKPASKSAAKDKKLTSLEATWKRETKGSKTESDLTLIARPEALNVGAALEALLGSMPEGLTEATVQLDSFTFKAGTKGYELILEAEKAASFKFDSAEFALTKVSLKAGNRGKKKDEGKKSSGAGDTIAIVPTTAPQPEPAKAEKEKVTSLSLAATMQFHTWGSASVSYTVPGEWAVSTTIPRLSLKKIAHDFCGVKDLPWSVDLKDTTFSLEKKGDSFGAGFTTTIVGLGTSSLKVIRHGSEWGLGMQMSLEREQLSGGGLSRAIRAFMDAISMDRVQLGYCSIATPQELKFPGSAMTGGQPGFALTARWNLAPNDSELPALKQVKKFLGLKKGHLDLRLLLQKAEQSLTISVPDIVICKATQPDEKNDVTLAASLFLKRSTGEVALGLTAKLDGFKISDVPCQFALALKATIGANASIALEGYLKAGKDATIPLWPGSSARLAEVYLMLGAGAQGGFVFGAAATVLIGRFKASACIYFAGASKTVVAFAMSDVSLGGILGGLFKAGNSPFTALLHQIELRGTPIVLKSAPATSLAALPTTREAAIQLAGEMMKLSNRTCHDLTDPSFIECQQGHQVWHLTDKRTLTQYTLDQDDKGDKKCRLVRKSQFRLATGTLTIGGGGTFNQGLFISARLEVLGWKAEALVDVSTAGAYIYGRLDPLEFKIFGFTLLSLTGATKVERPVVTLDQTGSGKGSNGFFARAAPPTFVHDPTKGPLISIASYKAERPVPEGVTLNPGFLAKGKTPQDFFSGIHGYANGYLRVFGGLQEIGVDCQISDQGISLTATTVMYKVLRCDLELTVFSGSGFTFGARLGLVVDELDLGILGKTKAVSIGGYLKIQVGGPGIALQASLGASFTYGGDHYVLGAMRVTLTQQGLEDMVGMLKNAVIDAIAAKVGFGESNDLEGKGRWTRIEVINDTPYTLVWAGSGDPTAHDIGQMKNAHGKYWQVPTDIPAYSSGAFSACERANAITGCGGVTPYRMELEGDKKAATLNVNIGWSNPLFKDAGDAIVATGAKVSQPVTSFFGKLIKSAGKTVGVQWIEKAGGAVENVIDTSAPHRLKCRASLENRADLWKGMDNTYLNNTTADKELSQSDGKKFHVEILSIPGRYCHVHLRPKGRILAGKVSTAGLADRGELALVSPGGMLYHMHRTASTPWACCDAPNFGRGVRQAEVLALSSKDSRGTEQGLFVMLVIASDYLLYSATKPGTGTGRWSPLKPVAALKDLKLGPLLALAVPAQPVTTAQAAIASQLAVVISAAEVKTKCRLEITLSSSRELSMKAVALPTEGDHTRDVITLIRQGETLRLGIGLGGTLMLEDPGPEWKAAFTPGRDRKGRAKDTIERLRNYASKDQQEALLAKAPKVLHTPNASAFLATHIKWQDKYLAHLHTLSSARSLPPARKAKPAKVQRVAAAVLENVLCIIATDENGVLWQIRNIASPTLRKNLGDSLYPPDLAARLDADCYEWKEWSHDIHPKMPKDPATDTQTRPDRRFISLTLGLSRGGHFELFAVDQDRTLWHTWSTDKSLTWNPWREHPDNSPRQVEKVTSAYNASGDFEVFLTTPDRELYSTRLSPANSTCWTTWAQIKP